MSLIFSEIWLLTEKKKFPEKIFYWLNKAIPSKKREKKMFKKFLPLRSKKVILS